ncbi:hypothetical protein THIARS_70646 [Thiomonas delicata]|uniref:Uncharacterized protein n=1 Tax=Thiomonas delicata TaxID=364030 RepID=A0A238D6T5_THIDL|nr:hypothetical protein THIARS_70646 [Thiomonas delicata]
MPCDGAFPIAPRLRFTTPNPNHVHLHEPNSGYWPRPPPDVALAWWGLWLQDRTRRAQLHPAAEPSVADAERTAGRYRNLR